MDEKQRGACRNLAGWGLTAETGLAEGARLFKGAGLPKSEVSLKIAGRGPQLHLTWRMLHPKSKVSLKKAVGG